MSDTEFVAYVGIADIHDGTILRISSEGETAEVIIEGYSGLEHSILFDGVVEIEKNAPEGMLLYALTEMRASPPLRRFVFANNNEDDQKQLSILATDFRVVSR